jgi:Family of unknown function (DUF6529)
MPTLRVGSAVSASISSAPARRGTVKLLIAAAIGAGVSVALGVYAKLHDPTSEQILHVGFPSTLSMKAWLTTGVVVLALAQAASAMWMWNRLPGVKRPAPRWVAHAHRWTGTAAFLLSLPVAYHCLWSLGWRSSDARVVIHGILGCAFFGALTVKLLALRIDGVSKYTLPVLGSALVVILTAIWLTSSLWFFTTIGFPGL